MLDRHTANIGQCLGQQPPAAMFRFVVPPLVPQPDVDHGIDLVLLQDGEEVVIVPTGGTDSVEGLNHFCPSNAALTSPAQSSNPAGDRCTLSAEMYCMTSFATGPCRSLISTPSADNASTAAWL